MYSLVIPVYKNEGSVFELLNVVQGISKQFDLEVVFVVDGSPDRSLDILREALPRTGVAFQLISLSRNFGSFSAIKTGLEHARGSFFAVMAADLQEPPELVVESWTALAANECDVVVGARESRSDPLLSRAGSQIFWKLYRRLINPQVPEGGVDVFACNVAFRDELVKLNELNSSLIGLIFWLGFRRKHIYYSRRKRTQGKSAWTLKKKVRYLMDSVFSFTDLPIRLLLLAGGVGLSLSVLISVIVVAARLMGRIEVPGYTPTIVMLCFFTGLNCLGFGVLGAYLWRAFENTKGRPTSVVAFRETEASRQGPGAIGVTSE
jgi:glycosyltransferase involved in cell wall biosynthesis